MKRINRYLPVEYKDKISFGFTGIRHTIHSFHTHTYYMRKKNGLLNFYIKQHQFSTVFFAVRANKRILRNELKCSDATKSMREKSIRMKTSIAKKKSLNIFPNLFVRSRLQNEAEIFFTVNCFFWSKSCSFFSVVLIVIEKNLYKWLRLYHELGNKIYHSIIFTSAADKMGISENRTYFPTFLLVLPLRQMKCCISCANVYNLIPFDGNPRISKYFSIKFDKLNCLITPSTLPPARKIWLTCSHRHHQHSSNGVMVSKMQNMCATV